LGTCGVEQRIAKRPEGGSGFADTVDQFQQFAGRAAKTVELGDCDHIAGLERRHQLGKLRPIGSDTADLLAVDRLRPGSL
jgi:hypothetical protein